MIISFVDDEDSMFEFNVLSDSNFSDSRGVHFNDDSLSVWLSSIWLVVITIQVIVGQILLQKYKTQYFIKGNVTFSN